MAVAGVGNAWKATSSGPGLDSDEVREPYRCVDDFVGVLDPQPPFMDPEGSSSGLAWSSKSALLADSRRSECAQLSWPVGVAGFGNAPLATFERGRGDRCVDGVLSANALSPQRRIDAGGVV
jgi:hypothetical protein